MSVSKVFERLFLVLVLLISNAVSDVSVGEFIEITKCTCPGDTLIYNCNVIGNGFTIWRGSAFDCSSTGSRILLRHSSFASSGSMGFCNGGAIAGHSLGASMSSDNTMFTSQLTVNLTASSSNLLGKTVECVYRNANGQETTIGSATIQVSDPPPPPPTIQLLSARPSELLFSWSSVDSNCLIHYSIRTDCGTCSSDNLQTVNTNVTCNIVQPTTTETVCSLAVQSVVCDNLTGNLSAPVTVTLKVPQRPQTRIIPYYDMISSKLITLDIKVTEVDSFSISQGIDGSAFNYTVSYTDSSKNALCHSLTIPSTSCINHVCTPPNLEPLPCSQNIGNGTIDVAISATNRLGEGPPSTFSICAVNRYVIVTFESKNRIICTFLGQQSNHSEQSLTCDIVYGPCPMRTNRSFHGTANSSTTVIIDLPPDHQSRGHCYTIIASNKTFMVVVQGRMGTNESNMNTPAVATGVVLFLSVVINLILALTIIILLLLWWKRRCHKSTFNKQGSEETPLENFENMRAHIIFDLQNQPQKLLKALTLFKDLINIKNIRVGLIEERPLERRIYIECEQPFTQQQIDKMEELRDEIKSLVVTRIAEDQKFKTDEDCKQGHNRIEITESLQHKPGALSGYLEFLCSIEEWQQINLADVIISRSQSQHEDIKEVLVKFDVVDVKSDIPDVAKEKYERKKHECQFIAKQETISKV